MLDPATFNTLRQFRAEVYDRFGMRRDALFELLDAATVAGLVASLAYLSLPAVHRRGWGSLYDALAAGRLDAAALRELIAGYALDDGQPIYTLDTSIWPRAAAETSPGEFGNSWSARAHFGGPGAQIMGCRRPRQSQAKRQQPAAGAPFRASTPQLPELPGTKPSAWPRPSWAGQHRELMAREQVLEREVVARAHRGQAGREQEPDEFKHAVSIAHFVRPRL